MSDDREGGILWGAFELREDGSVRGRIVRETADGSPVETPCRWASIDEAEDELGPGFGELAREVATSGSMRWRWRP